MRRNAWALTLALVSLGWTGCDCKAHDAAGGVPLRSRARSFSPPVGPVLRPIDGRDDEALGRAISRLAPLHEALPSPAPGDWLADHEEPGQTFAQYRSEDPVAPANGRDEIYIQPLGDLTATQREIVALASDYMERFFQLHVVIEPMLPLSLIPPDARRFHEESGNEQILTSHVLHDLLAPRLPRNAAAFISFTASDLWPGAGWNFVFGQASLRDRVGVWSIHRNGDPDQNPESYRLTLLRTLKIAVHETAHMFSLKHCTAFACVMNGANNRDESDRHPLELCPECMAKICWTTSAEPVLRYERLAEFAQAHGFAKEAAFFRQSIEALR